MFYYNSVQVHNTSSWCDTATPYCRTSLFYPYAESGNCYKSKLFVEAFMSPHMQVCCTWRCFIVCFISSFYCNFFNKTFVESMTFQTFFFLTFIYRLCWHSSEDLQWYFFHEISVVSEHIHLSFERSFKQGTVMGKRYCSLREYTRFLENRIFI